MHLRFLFPYSFFFARLLCCLWLSLWVGGNGLSAQDYPYTFYFKPLKIQDGLSHREVFDIIQDDQGLIWIGTSDGLNRFDGYEFEYLPIEKEGFSQGSINLILKDAEGLLWLFNKNRTRHSPTILSLDVFNPQTEEVQSFAQFTAAINVPFKVEELQSSFSGSDGQLFFFTTKNELWSYHPQRYFESIPIPSSFTPVRAFGETVFGYTKGHLLELDKHGQVIQTLEVGDFIVLDVAKGESGNLCVYLLSPRLDRKLLFFKEGKIKDIAAPKEIFDNRTMAIGYHSLQKTFWLASSLGIIVLDEEGELQHVYDDSKNSEDVIDRGLNALFFDEKGLGWLATYNGMIMAELKPDLFRKYFYRNPNKYKIEDFYRCRGLLEWNGKLFVNTSTKRYAVDLESGLETQLPGLANDREVPKSRFPFLQGRDQRIWTGADGLILLDSLKLHDNVKYPSPYPEVIPGEMNGFTNRPPSRIWSLYQSTSQRIWVGNAEGLWYFDPGIHNSVKVYTQLNEFSELADATILDFFEDQDGTLWILSDLGLYVLEEENGVVARYSMAGEGAYHLPATNIQHMYQDEAGIYWLGTKGKGLLRWDRDKQKVTQFDREDGFPNNNIYAVYEDDFNHLWMSSDYGILQFDKATKRVKMYGPEDGTTFYEYNRISHFQNKKGEIYFGSLNGVTAFDPSDFHGTSQSGLVPPPRLIELNYFANDQHTISDGLPQLQANGKVELRPAERVSSCKVLFPYFSQLDNIRYYFKVDGNEKMAEWAEVKNNEIPIVALEPGQYTVRIKARSIDGKIVSEELVFPLGIQVPLRHQPAVITGSLLVLLLLLYAFFRWRTGWLKKRQLELEDLVAERTRQIELDKTTIEKQAKELRQLDKMKSRFFTNVAHELRTPLSLILGPVQQLQKGKDREGAEQQYLTLIQQNANNLLHKIKEILDLSKLEHTDLEVQASRIKLAVFLEEELKGFQALAKHKGIQLDFKSEIAADLETWIDEKKLSTVFNNLLSNAIKFTNKGDAIRVWLKMEKEIISVIVVDNGIGIHEEDLPYIFDRFYQAKHGRERAEGGTGIGLALSLQLMRLLGGDIQVESRVGEGSRFVANFPYVVPEQVVAVPPAPITSGEDRAISREKSRPYPTSEKQILLVEDNPQLQEYLQLLLVDFQLIFANNGQEALDFLANSPTSTDLIISDIMMPVMDGFTLLHKLKADERYAAIPVIMLTARADIQDKLKALRIGVDDYITKPFQAEDLVNKIQDVLKLAQVREKALMEEALPVEEEKTSNLAQQKWLEELEKCLLANLSRRKFTQDDIASGLFISKRQLTRRVKQYTGMTLNQYHREIRLQTARRLLEHGEHSTVSEVSHQVGFEDQHYFSTLYLDRFGKKPSEYFQTV